ncbi:MAG: efflux RND transporter periplasmic adaptor subunit [Gammaproteobacteria bacterium]|nr:efflux RND transporter periplasmic adaptor subunit [Gammaproteobacteria bacterium]MDE0273606.1 efflux RND transporter periplasmic adaptor subunit [Gammaproteobacteria bacterium]
MIRQHLGALLVLAVGVGVAALIVATGPTTVKQPSRPDIPVVQATPVQPRWVQMTVRAHGEVMPKTESNLVAEVAGRVVSVAPAMVSGGFFAKDDVLVEIESVDYRVALEQARARLASRRSDLDTAEKDFDRLEELAETQFVSESARDAASNQLAVASAALRSAQASLERAERDLARTQITAPYDGRVRTERLDVGQFVNRGETIAALYSIDYAKVRLPIRDVDLAFLPLSLANRPSDEPPPKARLRAEFAGAEHFWVADVVRTEGELDPLTRMVNVVAQVPKPYEPAGASPPLTVGLFVEAEIFDNWVEDVFIVPRTALQEGGKVYVVADDGRLSFRDMAVLRRTGETLYLQGELESSEVICLSPLANATEGQRVRTILANEV